MFDPPHRKRPRTARTHTGGRTAANNWTATYVNSSISSTTTESTCASAFAAHMAYIASHGYIYANYRTCN